MACHRTLNTFLVSISLLHYSVVWIFLLQRIKRKKAMAFAFAPDGHVEVAVERIVSCLDCS